MTNPPTIPCDWCNKTFTPQPRSRPDTRFCCLACRHAWHQHNPDSVAKTRERQLRYWHKPDGGYIRSRKRTLARYRAEVLERLEEVRRLVDQPR